MENYKEDIVATRLGCLGSSDGRILAHVSAFGEVPKSAYKRMAVVKGLIPQVEIPKTAAIQAGDDVEMMVYDYIKSTDTRYESNPLWVSEKYSKPNVKLISHPDIVLVDEPNKVIDVYEVKATKFDVESTRQTYKTQLYIHYVIAQEIAAKRGKDWTVRLFLAHYSTDGLELEHGVDFDPSRLTVRRVKFSAPCFDVNKAMTIINTFLSSFTEYYDGDEIDADMLPVNIKEKFDLVTRTLRELKESEAMIENFKEKLFLFMQEKGIKSIKNDMFAITCVEPSVQKKFNAKKYLEDLAKDHPRKANKIQQQYTTITNRKGYATIKIKNEKEK